MKGARKIAHYWYSDGNEIAIFARHRAIYVRDGKTGGFPIDPEYSERHPHPDDGQEMADFSYETLGLYYEYAMADTGWSGDC